MDANTFLMVFTSGMVYHLFQCSLIDVTIVLIIIVLLNTIGRHNNSLPIIEGYRLRAMTIYISVYVYFQVIVLSYMLLFIAMMMVYTFLYYFFYQAITFSYMLSFLTVMLIYTPVFSLTHVIINCCWLIGMSIYYLFHQVIAFSYMVLFICLLLIYTFILSSANIIINCVWLLGMSIHYIFYQVIAFSYMLLFKTVMFLYTMIYYFVYPFILAFDAAKTMVCNISFLLVTIFNLIVNGILAFPSCVLNSVHMVKNAFLSVLLSCVYFVAHFILVLAFVYCIYMLFDALKSRRVSAPSSRPPVSSSPLTFKPATKLSLSTPIPATGLSATKRSRSNLHSPPKYHILKPSYQLIDLNSSSKKFDFICKLCSHTWLYNDNAGRDARNLNHRTIKITNIKTVENSTLWKKYINKRNRMPNIDLPKLPFPVRTTNYRRGYSYTMEIDSHKEYLLFHGTKTNNIDSITRNGFSLTKANDGLYGRNIYFSDSCQKADQYTDYKHSRSDGQDLMIILARVALGNSAKHSEFDPSKQDSSIGGTAETSFMRFYEFMIGNEEQCFPEYVIYYNRI